MPRTCALLCLAAACGSSAMQQPDAARPADAAPAPDAPLLPDAALKPADPAVPDAAAPDAAEVVHCQRPAVLQQPVWTSGRFFPRFPAPSYIYRLNAPTVLEDQPVSWRAAWRITDSAGTMA